ncbi:MAG TPA: 2-succinyl-6-hydroxy-2,4-cyclohexadiene-1-carboxylate synthase, partial [Acetobacteraceae bacterium]|nr:2-succinyl-6-hydroxy-2,4-cyclohexadiene-1-carboxylate synthase [Acetobacteraceae bacterium]
MKRRLTVNGLGLNVERQGIGAPLVLLHGFTGSTASWGTCMPELAQRFTVYAVDLVGHGRTEAPDDLTHYRMPTAVADLAALLDALELERVALLGYSMGGRTALRFAVAYPERVRTLILESASPGIADPLERATRRRSDEALADHIERDGLATFVREWEQLPLFRSQARLPAAVRAAQRDQRLQCNPRGLANSLRGMGAGVQEPVWDALAQLSMPVRLITGQEDDKYGALARSMAERLRDARLAIVAEAGHAV